MDLQLRTDDADAQQRVNDFYRFIDDEEAKDRVQFTIKAGRILTHSAPHFYSRMAGMQSSATRPL